MQLDLPGVHLHATDRYIEFGVDRPNVFSARAPVELTIPGRVESPVGALSAGAPVALDRIKIDRLLTVCGPYHALCDADALEQVLTIRARRPGDRIRPLGLGGSRKLQDILTDCHVPADERDSIAVVENGRHPVWVPGFVLDERVAITASTTRIVHLHCQPISASNRGRMPRFP